MRPIGLGILSGLSVAALTIGVQHLGNPDRSDSTPVSEARGVETQSPLDGIPGFGKSHDAMQRDDAIALWEAFKRERLIQACMQDQAQLYIAPDLASRRERERVAEYLGIDDLGGEPEWSPQPPPHDDAYWLALYDISAEEAQQGLGNSNHGCVGKSWRALPGLWSLKTVLAEDQADVFLRADRSPSMEPARRHFRSCASENGLSDVSSPGDLDALMTELDHELVMKVMDTCGPAYDRAHTEVLAQEEAAFVKSHPELDRQREQYSDVLSKMAQDKEFLSFLRDGNPL